MTDHGVIVGVNGRMDDTAAFRFAAETAALIGAEVTLAHAVHMTLPPPPPSPLQVSGPVLDIGRAIVGEAAQQYAATTGGSCRTVVERGAPGVVLTRLSESADMVVLGHRHLATAKRLVTRSTTFSVAAHAHCLVAAVPIDWSPSTSSDNVVLVGAHEDGVPDRLLRAAYEIATQRGASLRMLHAWRLEPQYDSIIDAQERRHWNAEVEARLRTAAERFTGEFPKVAVAVEVQHEWPARALVEATAASRVVVVGRHQTRGPLPAHIGSLTRTVLDRAEGPVIVVPL